MSAARELGSTGALEVLLHVCRLAEEDLLEAPLRVPLHFLLEVFVEKMIGHELFRLTAPNAVRYLLARRDVGQKILWRLRREGY